MKSIAFFISSNGYGHYDRCKTIASYLEDDYIITFFSNFFTCWASFVELDLNL